jgi:DUF4097 and DUF4098 domain-containing protein YvlB
VEKHRTLRPAIVGAAVIISGAIGLAQQPAVVTVPFSDSGRPGTLRVNLTNGTGRISIQGENRKDVSIGSEERGNTPTPPRPDGLRRLTPSGGFQVTEENNEMTINASRANFDIRVPSKTNVRLSSANGGPVVIDAIEGEIEVNNTNSSVTLTNIRGSIVANSTNGKVTASFAAITANKAMAFTSMNGPIDVTIPASTKANLKLQTEHGDVYSDFDVQLRPSAPPRVEDSQRRNGRFQLEVNRAISGTINGGGPEFEFRTFNGNIYLRKAK